MHFLAFNIFTYFNVTRVWGWVEAGGYYVLFGLLFACGLGLPLPEDIPLLIAGALIAQHHMNLAIASVAAWCGIIGGDCVLYHIGKKYGLEITRIPFIGKHVTKKRIERAERLFERWGTWVVAVGRLFAGVRGAMVVAAGAIRFNFVKFVIADGLAALVSGGAWIALGYFVGDHIDAMREKIHGIEHWVVLGILVVAVPSIAFYVLWRRRRHKTLADIAIKKVVEKAGIELHPPQSSPQSPAAAPPPATQPAPDAAS
jgi:membrane protein DedA with SNARE-associated domain